MSSLSFSFIKDQAKMNLLRAANEILHLTHSNNRVVFVYSVPKVGSTSIVSTLRIFASDYVDIIHIHDENMLEVFGNIKGITVKELIEYNKYIGKDVYVIDVYRSPIERKISAFFEKIGVYHFNNTDENINKYNIDKIIKRFNNIFPYIANGDHFMDKYDIPIPEKFDFNQKCLLLNYNGIKYIKLRLKDASIWGKILSNLFKINMILIKDYESDKKIIKNVYNNFKNNYKIPINILNEIMQDKYFKYYYSQEEQTEYYNTWLNKSTNSFIYYNLEQYKLYEELTLENCHIEYIQKEHYIDEGCKCNACRIKRYDIANKLFRGIPINTRIIHVETKNDMIKQKIKQAVEYNKIVSNMKSTRSQELRHMVTRRNY